MIAVFYLASALRWDLRAADQIWSTGGLGLGSNAIDTLADYLERNCQGKRIKVLDWGLSNNLFVLSGSRISAAELFWGGYSRAHWIRDALEERDLPGDVYVLHSPGLVQFPAAGDGFRRSLAASGLPYRRTEFYQKGGARYAAVVEILDSAR